MSETTGKVLDAGGRPARFRDQDACPQCGAGKQKREASGGFGARHTQCGVCGYEWKDLVWRD